MKFCSALLLTIALSFSCANATQTNGAHIYHYQVFSKAEDVGDITVKVIDQADGSYVIVESTLLEFEGFWGDIEMHSTQIETFSSEGDLLKADVKTLSGKKAYWQKAELSGDELWASYTQVQNVTEKEEGEFVGAVLTMASTMAGDVGSALGVAQLLFSDSEAPPDNVRFSASAYDTSFSNLPFYWSSKQHNLPAQLNLFDSEELVVNTFDVEYLGQETVQTSSDEKAVITSHYKLQPLKGQPLEIWLASSDHNSPYFYQLVGADDDGPFRIRLEERKGE